MNRASRTSSDELLAHELKEREERDTKSRGSDVYLNVYDMVCTASLDFLK